MNKPITAWSYSRYALWERCPAAFKFKNIDKIPEPRNPNMERGDEIHQNMAAILTDQPLPFPNTPPPRSFNKFVGMIEQIKANRPVVEQKWAFDNNWRVTDYFARDTWYRAILDVGVLWPDNTFTVIDWKTGKPYGENAEQMEQFAIAVMSRYPQVNALETRLEYLDTGQEQHAEYTRAELPSLRKKWEGLVEPMLNDKVFTPRPNSQCNRCHFRKSNGGPCAFG